MISPVSITDKYILQPTLLNKHKKTLEWLSTAVLWKTELAFFQKLLDKYAAKFSDVEDKKQIGHFQSLIIYYNGELINSLTHRLRSHENKLADMLKTNDETKLEYFTEHDELMNQLESLSNQFVQIKMGLFAFIEKAM